MGGLEGKPSKYNRGGVTEGCSLLVYNDVLSPLLHPSGGAVRTDLYAEAPHSSDNSVPCPAGSAACQQRQFWSLLLPKVICKA